MGKVSSSLSSTSEILLMLLYAQVSHANMLASSSSELSSDSSRTASMMLIDCGIVLWTRDLLLLRTDDIVVDALESSQQTTDLVLRSHNLLMHCLLTHIHDSLPH
jgi:hypothetical protein